MLCNDCSMAARAAAPRRRLLVLAGWIALSSLASAAALAQGLPQPAAVSLTAAAPPAPAGARAPGGSDPAGQTALLPLVKPVPKAASAADVEALEKRLEAARAELGLTRMVEQGTTRSGMHVRARVVLPYAEAGVFELKTAPERMTVIDLEPGEAISGGKPRAADTVQWVVDTVESGAGAERRVSVLVKPMAPGLETDLLIPTNRRSYYLVLRADSQAYMPRVSFTYPFDAVRAQAPETPPVEATAARREPLAMAVEQLRFSYVLRASGERVAFKPLRVFDDGSKTYLQMPASLRSDEAPVLFVIEADTGTPQLTNYRVRGDYYVVDRLFEHAQLRIGPHQAVDIERSAAALPWLNG